MERLKELLPLWALLAVVATAFGALGTMSPEGTLRRKIYYVLVLACVLMALLPSVIVFVPSIWDSLSPLPSTPRQAEVIPTTPPPLIPSPTTESTGPFREHQTASIGTGAFAQVTLSDGLAPYEEGWLQTYHFRHQRIRPEENPAGCGVSVFDTNKVWFSSSANTVFTVNGQEIGKLVVATGKHGYVFDYAIHVGDNLCAVGFAPSGYQIVIGPDMYYHYDSYCYRGNC